MESMRGVRSSAIAVSLAALLATPPASPFTQGTGPLGEGITPQGHEWLTKQAALELIGEEAVVGKRAALAGTQLLDKVSIATIKQIPFKDDRYLSKYVSIYDAILGERWVDLGGFNLTTDSVGEDCWLFVTQYDDSVQHDHFLRERDETGAAGAKTAIENAKARFISYFAEAATAPNDVITITSGGLVAEHKDVQRTFFLFGRALHILQDGFSPEHVIRLAKDNYQQIHGVNSFLCSRGSFAHTPKPPFSARELTGGSRTDGDVIWLTAKALKSDWNAANVKPEALVALEATKDAWAEFTKVIVAEPDPKKRQLPAMLAANRIVTKWFAYTTADLAQTLKDHATLGIANTYVDDTDVAQATCDVGISARPKRAATEKVGTWVTRERTKCVYNIKADPSHPTLDEHLKIPYFWHWEKKLGFNLPPNGWKIGDPK